MNGYIKGLFENVKAGTMKVMTSQGWKDYLDVTKKFWNYSYNNKMLIWWQCEAMGIKPSKIAGKTKWAKLGRKVKWQEKSKGIDILVPIIDKATNECKGFITRSVYDMSQTEGKEVTTYEFSKLEGNAPEGMMDNLLDYAKKLKLNVKIKELPEGLGGYVDALQNVVLNGNEAQKANTRTIIHEISHYLAGHVTTRRTITRAQAECEAESIAYVVASVLGLDVENVSFEYLASWLSSVKGLDTQEKLMKEVGVQVMKTSSKFLKGMGVKDEFDTAK